jgi:hypothetical protein
MFKMILLILSGYPFFFIVDLIYKNDWLASYNQFMMNYWDLILVILLCTAVYKRTKFKKYEYAEEVRRQQFFAEFIRYHDTPYVPPVMLMYLKNPPGSIQPTDYAYVNSTFYRTVVNTFRDRVYILQDFSKYEPDARISYFEVFGYKNLAKIVLYLSSPFLWYAFVTYNLDLSIILDWPILMFPIVFSFIQRGVYLLQTYFEYLPLRLDLRLAAMDCNILVTWRDAFPDRDVGETFIRSYYFEKEKRQRYDYTLRGYNVPTHYPEWNNGNFAPYPFPSIELPNWEDEFENMYEKKKEVQQYTENKKRKVKGNVVSFPK